MPPNQAKETSAFTEALRILYIGTWLLLFYLKYTVFSWAVTILLVVLSVLELIGPILHNDIALAFIKIPHDSWQELALSCLLLVTAIIIVLHHRYLEIRVHKHRGLIGQMVVILGEESVRNLQKSGASNQIAEAVTAVLDSLVDAVKYRRENASLHASVLFWDAQADRYILYAQDSESAFPAGLVLDGADSGAGKAGLEAAGALIYIPCAKHTHGVRIAREPSPKGSNGTISTDSYKTARPVLWAFQSLGQENSSFVNSLLCTKIPTIAELGAAGPSRGRYVLCLTSRTKDCFNDLEFSAVKFFASVLSFALK